MKEVRVIISDGDVKILAEGVAGKGTAEFTEKLAKDLGKIEERHKGMDHLRVTQKNEAKQGQG